jgi:hypothetical protein
MIGKALGALLFLVAPCAAQATWLKAESAHFIVYSEGDEASVRSAATRLEKLDALQRTVAGAPKGTGAKVRSPVKVRVYLLPTSADVQMTAGGGDAAGYYSATVRGPFAVMTRENDVADGFPAQLVLFHELTHHFMFQYFPATYPTWYQEGFADFIGASTIDASDVVKFGKPVLNRYFSLRGRRAEDWISLKRLLSAKSYGDLAGRVDLLYAEGWLLTHYLSFEKKRDGQLQRYLAEINAGKPYDVAARDAFGDLEQLNKELRAYAEAPRLPAGVLTLQAGDIGPVTVTQASDAQAALMVADIRIGNGILATEATRFARGTAKIAARFPDDPFALRMRAEADRLAEDRVDEAAAVADWGRVAPGDPLMLLHRGQLAIDALVAAKSHDPDAWRRAHELVLDAHRAAPQNPEILKAYYDGFIAEGVLPPVGAHNALFAALEIVPQDDEVRYELASDFEKRGLIADAIATIRPSAYGLNDDSDKSPRQKAREKRHQARYRDAGEVDHESAREMLVRLEALTPASPVAVSS